ncbi:MAG: gliding motility-associated protein GldE [Bacteroidales bacterium]|nr:gliding motility-associated protein GldE [Bacteroidales bacterium]
MDSGYFFSQWADSISFLTPSFGAILAALFAVLFLGASGFISASEIAFFSLSPNDIKTIEELDSPHDKSVVDLLKTPNYLLATLLIANNFVNVALVIFANFFLDETVDFHGNTIEEFVVKTVILTFLLLLFGEIMPKIYASSHCLKQTRSASNVLLFLRKMLKPIAYLLVSSSKLVNKAIIKQNRNISMDELSHALELTSEEINDEKDILQGIIHFGDKMVVEVMTPRIDISAVDIKLSFKEVLNQVIEKGYSRIPVYSGKQDVIKGILYIKDLLPYLNKADNFRWQSLIRPAFFIPETKKIDTLLEEFKTQKIHLAIVVDEYGGTSGLITLEDVLEEIVGEISDEYDDDEKQFIILEDGSIIFEAKILMNDFYKVTDINEEEFEDVMGEAETLAGLILEMKGDFPARREIIHHNQYTFQILEMDKRRIQKIKFWIEPPKETKE